MKNKLYAWLIVAIITIFAAQGCGLKPDIGVPRDITPEQALSVLERQLRNIETFSGTGSVKVLANGTSETATTLIRYTYGGDLGRQ